MSTTLVPGQRVWSGSRNRDGDREYKIKYLVRCSSPKDGPATALQTPGLPQPGDTWEIDDDVDLWATCKLDATVTPKVENEANQYFEVEFTFSTKPDPKRCKDVQNDDPLLIPDRISGGSTPYQEEAAFDRFGKPIQTSSFEQIRGAQVEFDADRATITVEQNRAALEFNLFTAMLHTVNDDTLWGFPPRSVKLTTATWDRKFYGNCSVYYTRTFKFDIRYTGTFFDKSLLDEGTKVLKGHWDTSSGAWVLDRIGGATPDRKNPQHFDKFTDRSGNPAKVILNGFGLPAGVITSLSDSYMSIIFDNVGHALTDATAWLRLTPKLDWVAWNGGVTYLTGDVVIGDDGAMYAAIASSNNSVPSSSPSKWLLLLDGANDGGEYSNTTHYNLGTYVQDPAGDQPGRINVQKYEESNFLLLGIPLEF